MPEASISEQVDRRLLELYERHREAAAEGTRSYYTSGRGYHSPDEGGSGDDPFGIAFVTAAGQVHTTGDCDARFALQSLSKVFAYGLALSDHGREGVLEHVGVEPSGEAFNSILFDEHHHQPHNPMVNAGALVTTDLVRGGSHDEKLERIIGLLRRCAGNDTLAVDEQILASEFRTADRNRAIAYLMRSNGMLTGDVEELLSLYLHQCSVQVTCRDLAVMAATLANGCVNPLTGERALERVHVRDVLSVMYTCGMYDAAGQWAYEIGVPAKSGVSGGILAAIPGKLGIGVFSPGLDDHGNSARGVRVCEEISDRLGLHVFATEGEDTILGTG